MRRLETACTILAASGIALVGCSSVEVAPGSGGGGDVAWSKRFDVARAPAVQPDDAVLLTVASVQSVTEWKWRAMVIAPNGDVLTDEANSGGLVPLVSADGSPIFVGAAVDPAVTLGDASFSVNPPSLAAAQIGPSGSLTWSASYDLDTLELPGGTMFDEGGWAGAGIGADGRFAIETAPFTSWNERQIAITVLSSNGALLWSRTLGASKVLHFENGLAIGAGGEVWVGASFVDETLDLGAGPEPKGNSPKKANTFIARYGPAGDLTFHRLLASGDSEPFIVDIAVAANGDALVAIWSEGPVDFGNGPLGAPGVKSGHLARLDPQGQPLWVHEITSPGPIAVGPDGDIWSCGTVSAGEMIDGQPAVVDGRSDVLLTRFTPDGRPIWHGQWGDSGLDQCMWLAVGPSGAPFIAGTFEDRIDFGQGPLVAQHPKGDWFVAKLRP